MFVRLYCGDGCCNLSFFLENIMDYVLEGLKVISQTLDQLDLARRSEFKMLADNSGVSTFTYRLVSSANRCMFPLTSDTMSLMYNMKSRGPRIEPWGTPDVTLAQGENEFDTTTLRFRPDGYEMNQLRRLALQMPIEESL